MYKHSIKSNLNYSTSFICQKSLIKVKVLIIPLSTLYAYRCLKGEYILGGRGGFRECPTVAYGCLKEGGPYIPGGRSRLWECRI